MLHAQQHAEHVGIKNRRVGFACLLNDRAGMPLGPRIVHGHVQPAKPLDGGVNQIAHVVFAANIGPDELGFSSLIAECSHQLAAGVFAAPRHDEPRSLLGER